jgi:hypothetical protein
MGHASRLRCSVLAMKDYAVADRGQFAAPANLSQGDTSRPVTFSMRSFYKYRKYIIFSVISCEYTSRTAYADLPFVSRRPIEHESHQL